VAQPFAAQSLAANLRGARDPSSLKSGFFTVDEARQLPEKLAAKLNPWMGRAPLEIPVCDQGA
jgi:hypothetical protein